YSHEFVGDKAPPETKWEKFEQYQAWMRIRMAELKREGQKSHSQCLELAKCEWDQGGRVVKVPSDAVAACRVPGLNKESFDEHVLQCLGMTVDVDLSLLTVKDGGPLAFCNVPLDPTNGFWKIVAVGRGETKHRTPDLPAFL
ncbi:unnamed protein product, partial [Symbiodinium pilosum]